MIIATYTRLVILRIIPSSLSVLNYSVKSYNKSTTSIESTNQLIKTLNNRSDYERAFHLFDNLVKQNNINIISLLTILDTCIRSGQIERGRQIELLINQSLKWKDHIRLQTSLMNMYMKCQMIDQGIKYSNQLSKTNKFILAERIFERIRQLPDCDVIVYNAMLVSIILSLIFY
jgi:hypothetical protein